MAVLPPDPVFNLRQNDVGPINSICMHKDQRLFSGSVRGVIHLWDLQVRFQASIISNASCVRCGKL